MGEDDDDDGGVKRNVCALHHTTSTSATKKLMMTLKANYLTLAVQQEENQNIACELPVAAVDVLSAHRLAASFYVTAQRGHSLKARLTEGDIVRLMSPRFPPPLPFPSSCSVAPLCFLPCFPSRPPLYPPFRTITRLFPPSRFLLTSILGIDK